MRFPSLLLVLFLVGCRGDERAGPGEPGSLDLAATTVSALDSLAASGAQVSINGRVSDQRAGERVLTLDDGTGLVRVELPEALPMLVGQRLFVQGTLRQEDGRPVLDAAEWLYDSTAVSVRSD
jgi:hypothetical protein